MKKFLDKILRKTRKWTDIIPIALIIAFILLLAGQILGEIIDNMINHGQYGSPVAQISWQYFRFIGIWVMILLPLLFKANRPMIKALLFNQRGNNLKGLLFGTLLGFGMNALAVVISLLRKDIGIHFECFEPLNLLLIFVCVMVQSGAEEMVDRWFVLNKLMRRYRSPWVAIIANSVMFAALHLANPGINAAAIGQICAIGLLLSIMCVYYDSLWGAIMVHTAWNFTQNIIFGLPNSGLVTPYSMFVLDAASDGPFFDHAFGVEGSYGAVVVIVLAAIAMYVYARKKKLPIADVWVQEEQRLENENKAAGA